MHVRMYKYSMHVCIYESLLIFLMMYSSYVLVPAKRDKKLPYIPRYTHVRMYKCSMHVCVYESLLIFVMMYSSYILVPAKRVTRSYHIYINTHACLQYARVYFRVLGNICQYVFIIYIGTSEVWQGVALYTFVCMYACSMHVCTYESLLMFVMMYSSYRLVPAKRDKD